MYRRFRDRRRTMSQLNILQQQVQYREADHQNCADDENGPNTSKERCTDLRIEGFEQVWTVVISAESFFQFRTHLRQQYGFKTETPSLQIALMMKMVRIPRRSAAPTFA